MPDPYPPGRGLADIIKAPNLLGLMVLYSCSGNAQSSMDENSDVTAASGMAAPARQRVSAEIPSGCLDEVWRYQRHPNRSFDIANDRTTDNNFISCSTYSSPFLFASVLNDLRQGVQSRRRELITRHVSYPLLWIGRSGRQRRIRSARALSPVFDEVFDRTVSAVLRCARLRDLGLVPSEGAYVAHGVVWLRVFETSAAPMIVTINQAALPASGRAC